MRHLFIVPLSSAPGRVTDRWEIRESRNGHLLGIVQWRTPWRCYCFEPCFPTVFEHECLRDIADFIETETKKRLIAALAKKEKDR